MKKTQSAFLVFGFSLIILNAGLLIFGTTYLSNIQPVHYNLGIGDQVSWGIYDKYTTNGELQQEYKAVLNAKIIGMQNDSLNQPDIAILSSLILGEFNGQQIQVPMYVDIYTFTSILYSIITSKVTIPNLDSVQYVKAQTARDLQYTLEQIGDSHSPSADNISELAQYISFFNIGILPTTFNYTILSNFFKTINTVTQWLFKVQFFQISDSASLFSVSVNSTVFKNMTEELETAGVRFYDNESTSSLTMSWDKGVSLLKEITLTVVSGEFKITRTCGLTLVRTTFSTKYPHDLSQTEFPLDLTSVQSDVNTLKTENLILLVLSVVMLLAIIYIARKRR